jgi:hypothetical protein
MQDDQQLLNLGLDMAISRHQVRIYIVKDGFGRFQVKEDRSPTQERFVVTVEVLGEKRLKLIYELPFAACPFKKRFRFGPDYRQFFKHSQLGIGQPGFFHQDSFGVLEESGLEKLFWLSTLIIA